MTPTRPADCTDPQKRARELGKARDTYRYDFSDLGLCFVERLPIREYFPPRYLLKGAEAEAALAVNRTAAFLTDGGYDAMYPTLPPPLARSSWSADAVFAWQRVAGPVPQLISRIAGPPAWLPEALRHGLDPDRLYVVDYGVFDGVPAGTTDGRQKYLWAPEVLLTADPSLRPVAIRIGAEVTTPADGVRWLAARTAAQIADENFQGIIAHIGWCHFVIQRFILAGHRQLSAEHPLMVLLAPHFEFTLAVNEVARKSVIAPGGSQDRLLAPPIDVQASILNAALDRLDLASLDPTVDFARRGVDRDGLPEYPFRDDGLPAWAALQRWIRDYVGLYYTSDAAVAADTELAAFIAEVGAPDGGRLPNLVAGFQARTVDDVVQLVSRIVFRLTTYHASINDSSWDWVGYVPNMPTAGFAPLPGPEGTRADWEKMLTPPDLAWETITATYNVYALKVNHLGQYPAFDDPRVAPLLARYQADLQAIEQEIAQRNAGRLLPYTFLLPSRVALSINA
jgi:arachidonate 15-lipoxygenase